MLHKKKDSLSSLGDQQREALFQLNYKFIMNRNEMLDFIEQFHSEMDRGLAGEPSSLKMLPAFVGPPTGNEAGEFMALDFGGTNFRVLSVRLFGKGIFSDPRTVSFPIPKELLTGTRRELFGFMTACIYLFQKKHNSDPAERKDLGFTFSFPLEQASVDSGKLILWTKGFDVSGVVGEDVVLLLEQALAERGITNLKVVCLVNDAVGVLVALRYVDKNCDTGVILATGTNGAYVEKKANIKKLGYSDTAEGEMIINVEWGEFNKLRQNEYDRLLDADSNDAGHAFLEKMVSAKYLGELARLIIVDYADRGMLSYAIKENVAAFDSFTTEHLSMIANDNWPRLQRTNEIISDLGVRRSTEHDRIILKKISQIVYARSMKIAALATASLILKNDPELEREHVVAVDGSLFENAEGYRDGLLIELNQILGKRSHNVRLELFKDGSGIGAAIMAAIVS